MGLTITAYCGLEAIDAPRLDDSREPVDVYMVRFYWAPRFPQRADGLDISRVFRYVAFTLAQHEGAVRFH